MIIVNRYFEQKFFKIETDYLMSEVDHNFFAEPVYMIVTFARKHFHSRTQVAVSNFSCNTTTGVLFVNFCLSFPVIYLKRKILYWKILCFISN